jgi:2-polyprenyl-3-methyl-5-hydroxy-6-metoxy-1,4-benzoquinol methylase
MAVAQLSGRVGRLLPPQLKEHLRKYLDSRYERSSRVISHISAEDRVLDIGCVQHTLDDRDWKNPPFGLFLHADLARHGKEVIGLDVVEEEVERMSDAGYDVRVGDAQAFNFDGTFDAIVAGELVEHLENPGKFLECCREHLSEDGVIILTTPNPHNLQFSLWALLGESVNEEHTLWLDHDVMGTLAQRAGLSLAGYEYIAPLITAVSMPLYKLGIAKPVSAGGYVFVLKHLDSV